MNYMNKCGVPVLMGETMHLPRGRGQSFDSDPKRERLVRTPKSGLLVTIVFTSDLTGPFSTRFLTDTPNISPNLPNN